MSRKRVVIAAVLSSVAIICGCILLKYAMDSRNADNDFIELQKRAAKDDINQTGQIVTSNEKDETGVLSQYSSLKNQNSDLAGWIEIPNTPVNYPVMYSKDNWLYYMDKDFNRQDKKGGLPFLDIDCGSLDGLTNTIIYSHNMKDGSMFATLLRYSDEQFYKEHPTIYFDTMTRTGVYEIVAAFEVSASGEDSMRYNEFINTYDTTVFNDFIKEIKEKAFYDTGITPEYGDELLTLSTCAYHMKDGRMVVVAKRIMSQDDLIKKAVELPGLDEAAKYAEEQMYKKTLAGG